MRYPSRSVAELERDINHNLQWGLQAALTPP
jgi:hypothetical protein